MLWHLSIARELGKLAFLLQPACLKSCKLALINEPLGSWGGACMALTGMLVQIADMYQSQAIANQKGNKDEDRL